jgi:hypothetical protein
MSDCVWKRSLGDIIDVKYVKKCPKSTLFLEILRNLKSIKEKFKGIRQHIMTPKKFFDVKHVRKAYVFVVKYAAQSTQVHITPLLTPVNTLTLC